MLLFEGVVWLKCKVEWNELVCLVWMRWYGNGIISDVCLCKYLLLWFVVKRIERIDGM